MPQFCQNLVSFVRDYYQTNEFIPLHAPQFNGKEKQYVLETIESTFVSSVGEYVNQFEKQLGEIVKASAVTATVNGTSALFMALYVLGIKANDLVITQPLTFVATCNTINQLGAEPIFVDVERQSLGLCPVALEAYLTEHAQVDNEGLCREKRSGRIIRAVLPMHTFGHPVQLDEIVNVCKTWRIALVEDAAESLGSYYKGKHTGNFGLFAAFSFNGNKTITTGGGGAVISSTDILGRRVKHLTTTAKVAHPYEYYHDELGFNYRMPNLNAALGCAQLEQLEKYLIAKRKLAEQYEEALKSSELTFCKEPSYASSNYWLNAVLAPDLESRNAYLTSLNEQGVMTRPAWQLMHSLPMFSNALRGDLSNSEWLQKRLINLPSSPNFQA